MVRWPSVLFSFLVCAGATMPPVAAREAARPAVRVSLTAGQLEDAQAVVNRTCAACHNDRTHSGSLSLESFAVAGAGERAEIAEKMIRKLRAGLMPPAGSRRPDEAVLAGLADLLEAEVDA